MRMKMGYNFLKSTVFLLVLISNLTLFSAAAQEIEELEKEIGLKIINFNDYETLLQGKYEHDVFNPNAFVPAANHIERYLPLLKQKKVGLVANQTSVIFEKLAVLDTIFDAETEENVVLISELLGKKNTHLVDSLLKLNINVTKVFAPEHGFRGKADAGEFLKDGKDSKTGLPIVSLYGKNKKPSREHLENIDIMVFDIQDVGVRFYTYISTLHYIMEACAEHHIPLLVLDRPNPNGFYIDGPILESEYKSFVGMHPVPIVHGMTIGEYAQMINGEQWLKNELQCDLTIIKMDAYFDENTRYDLPIKPSPNLPNTQAINLYPSLCLFEGTEVSVGRGTNQQFQIIGTPSADKKQFFYHFTPRPNEGAKHPKYEGETCYGYDLSKQKELSSLNLSWLIEFYRQTEDKSTFFTPFFSRLAGTKKLQKQITDGRSEEDIKASWTRGLKTYDAMRQQYLLYR
jgi:uncharacterized protein YbbC (DUF1343 family)